MQTVFWVYIAHSLFSLVVLIIGFLKGTQVMGFQRENYFTYNINQKGWFFYILYSLPRFILAAFAALFVAFVPLFVILTKKKKKSQSHLELYQQTTNQMPDARWDLLRSFGVAVPMLPILFTPSFNTQIAVVSGFVWFSFIYQLCIYTFTSTNITRLMRHGVTTKLFDTSAILVIYCLFLPCVSTVLVTSISGQSLTFDLLKQTIASVYTFKSIDITRLNSVFSSIKQNPANLILLVSGVLKYASVIANVKKALLTKYTNEEILTIALSFNLAGNYVKAQRVLEGHPVVAKMEGSYQLLISYFGQHKFKKAKGLLTANFSALAKHFDNQTNFYLVMCIFICIHHLNDERMLHVLLRQLLKRSDDEREYILAICAIFANRRSNRNTVPVFVTTQLSEKKFFCASLLAAVGKRDSVAVNSLGETYKQISSAHHSVRLIETIFIVHFSMNITLEEKRRLFLSQLDHSLNLDNSSLDEAMMIGAVIIFASLHNIRFTEQEAKVLAQLEANIVARSDHDTQVIYHVNKTLRPYMPG